MPDLPRGAERFFISANNPNDGIGGGGCLCNPVKEVDATGPFAVFTATETDSNLSPHAVLCSGCALSFCTRLAEGAEIGEAGERDTSPAEDLVL